MSIFQSLIRYYYADGLETGINNHATVVRNGFIRKVFGVLSTQLSLAALVALPITLISSVSNYIDNNRWVLISAALANIVFLVTMKCSPGATLSSPADYLLLIGFTLLEGVLVGVLSAIYSKDIILLAGTITIGITIVLTIFAMQTKWDFTLFGGILVSGIVSLVTSSFFRIFLHWIRIRSLMYSCLGAVVFSTYLVYDVQLIAGDFMYVLDGDDEVRAALAVYVDFIGMLGSILVKLGICVDVGNM